jgi:uncharacterized protein YggE
MPQRTFGALLIALCSATFAGPAAAAEGSDATVHGSATVTLHPAATRLRMQMQLRAFGKTPEAALENLKARREAAVARLKSLGADAASISVSTPRVGPAAKAAPPVMYTAPVPAGGQPPVVQPPTIAPEPGNYNPFAPRTDPAKRPSICTASTTVRAEWTLPHVGESSERAALAAAGIMEKVRSMPVDAGAPQKLSAEEKEIVEEVEMGLAQAAPTYSPYAAPHTVWTSGPAGAVFVYVAVLSDEQRKAALAAAYLQAKTDAAELAEAAGMQLGSITSLSRNPFGISYYHEDEGLLPLKQLNEREVVAARADRLEFTVSVTVSYRLLPAGGKP